MFCAGDKCPVCLSTDTRVADESFDQNGDEVQHEIYFFCPRCHWSSNTYVEHFKLDYVEELEE